MFLLGAGLALGASNLAGNGSGAPNIRLPADGDNYSRLVARAVGHDESLDFHALRLAYLSSAKRKRDGNSVRDLREALLKELKAGNAVRIRGAAVKLLSANYTDMFGQKLLRESCAKLGDQHCAQQGAFVEFGLLKSVTASGDGKTCPTGWDVVSIDEEYFILAALGASIKQQSLLQGKPSCDAMDTVDADGKTVTYFFRIDTVLADEASMFRGGH